MTSHEPNGGSRGYGATTALFTLAAVLFVLWRAWVTDDAFITFRHVENCLAGHGPVFNVGHRVQGFTHPLWFLLLLAGATVLPVYAWAVTLGLICTAGLMLLIARFLRGNRHDLLCLIFIFGVLFSSRTFVEYQTSGLENALTHVLIAALWGGLLFRSRAARPESLPWIVFGCALLITTRPDHVLICLPLLIWTAAQVLQHRSRRVFARYLLALTPIVLWYGFATVYYGTPLPTPAYAKTALPAAVACRQGLYYLWDYAVHEPAHAGLILVTLVIGLVRAIRGSMRREPGATLRLCLTLGIWLHLAYVVRVGGDFMHGRFLLSALVATTIVAGRLLRDLLPGRDLRRAFTLVLAIAMAAACYLQVGSFDPVAALRHGARSLGDIAVLSPLIMIVALVPGAALIAIGYIRLRRRDPSRRASNLFAVLVLVQLLYGVAAIGGVRQPHLIDLPWLVAALVIACLLLSAYLAGRFIAHMPIKPGATAGAALILMTAVSSLCDLQPRWAHLEHDAAGITDEQVWYVGPWNRNRFREPQPYPDGNVRLWVEHARRLRAYADAHGPIATRFSAIGILSYHAGPDVHVVDVHGLTDPFIARLPAEPTSRVGHMKHDVPIGYLQSRGVIDILPDWERRLRERDPTLAADARALRDQAIWTDASARQRWERIQEITTGEVFSWSRFKRIPGYAWPDRP